MALYSYNPELRINIVDTITKGETLAVAIPAAYNRVI